MIQNAQKHFENSRTHKQFVKVCASVPMCECVCVCMCVCACVRFVLCAQTHCSLAHCISTPQANRSVSACAELEHVGGKELCPSWLFSLGFRYEVNPDMVAQLEEAGMQFVGRDETGERMEILELVDNPSDHPYFVAAQYHPEYKSRCVPHSTTPLLCGRTVPP